MSLENIKQDLSLPALKFGNKIQLGSTRNNFRESINPVCAEYMLSPNAFGHHVIENFLDLI